MYFSVVFGLALYRVVLYAFRLGITLAAIKNAKAKEWLIGRKRQQPLAVPPKKNRRLWMHCASVGEFEQGRPVIEALKQKLPTVEVILTFFSPSGYEACKDYALAHGVYYLPLDGRRSSRRFIDEIKPDVVVFVKYEFWYYYLKELSSRSIPTFLVSATFRASQPFFRWYGILHRAMLSFFSKLYVQDEHSASCVAQVLTSTRVQVAGDTRYDRVLAIAKKDERLPLIEKFCGNAPVFIAGSTWPDDEKLIRQFYAQLPKDWKLIIAPHEVDKLHIEQVQKLFSDDAICYSSLMSEQDFAQPILIIDNIGMLSRLYKYGALAYVGGGFNKSGMHNVLEPAAFGLPTFFGLYYKKFVEAVEMVRLGFAFSVANANELYSVAQLLMGDPAYRAECTSSIKYWMQGKAGATQIIVAELLPYLK